MTPEEIKNILEGHAKWLAVSAEGIRADLSYANLSLAKLAYANLAYANLIGADLSHADLADANLRGANLSGVNLRDSDLSGANLSYTNLYGADLYGADLYSADLRGTYLGHADLTEANLTEANLTRANFYGAKLKNIICAVHRKQIVPSSGSFYGFKKTREDAILYLLIPEKASRVGGIISRKCRASECYIESADKPGSVFTSQHDLAFRYTVGTWIRPTSFDPNPFVDCSGGIHFFITPEEAREF